MKKLFTFFCVLFFAVPAWSGPTFNLYAPANGIQKNTGFTYQNTAAAAADIAGTYTGQTGCSGSAALLFNAQCSIIPTVPVAANPSGLIGLTAVNGTAGTWERSDATHALDQGIIPAWTHTHTFNNGVSINGTLGVVNISSGSFDFNTNNSRWLSIGPNTTTIAGIAINADSSNFSIIKNIFTAQVSGSNLAQITIGDITDLSPIIMNGTTSIFGMTGSSGTGAYVCYNTTTGLLNFDTTATCPVSSELLKDDIKPVDKSLGLILKMHPVTYQLKNDNDKREYLGFLAEDMEKIAPVVVGHDSVTGKPNSVAYDRITALLVSGEQELQREIWELRAAVAFLFGWCAVLSVRRWRHG